MTKERFLIVNADDFGWSTPVNRGILTAHQKGIVTSASLLVRRPAAGEAASWSKEYPELSLGLHVDVGEWSCRDGEWYQVDWVVATDDAAAVTKEVERQLGAFRDYRGEDPTHLDSHQHVHREEPLRSILIDLARKLGIPLRHVSEDIGFCPNFYGQSKHGLPYAEGISVENLIAILAMLSPGWTEIGCHPGEEGVDDSVYSTERAMELATLCDDRVKQALRKFGIRLQSFRPLGDRR